MNLTDFETDVRRIITEALASAWDEGYQRGVNDERTSQEMTNSEIPPGRVNPYRADRIGADQ